jgi:thymidylate kinase
MKNEKVNIISIDGLHNVGKSTQIDLVKRQLGGLGIYSAVMRGDGSRKGLGLTEEDPFSDWWQLKRKEITQVATENFKAEELARETSRKLGRELLDFCQIDCPKKLKEMKTERGVILLNRGPLSRLFVAQRFEKNVSIDSALGYDEDDSLREILPDHIFVLQTDKEEILSRNETRIEGGQQKRDFNASIIKNYYDDFMFTINNLPKELEKITTIIDASPNIQDLNLIVIKLLLEKIGVEND